MATDIKIYHDNAGASPVTAINPLSFRPAPNGTAAALQVWVGSVETAGIKHRRKTNPGAAQLQASVYDGNLAAGLDITDFKLASTEAGLAGATAGAALNLGLEILAGAVNLVPMWIEASDSVGDIALHTDIQIAILDVEDVPA
jgi:hypothetical protein